MSFLLLFATQIENFFAHRLNDFRTWFFPRRKFKKNTFLNIMTKSQLLSRSLLSQLNGLQPSITTMTSTKTTATMTRMTMTTSKTTNGSNNDNNDNDNQNSKNKIFLVHSRKIRNQSVAKNSQTTLHRFWFPLCLFLSWP